MNRLLLLSLILCFPLTIARSAPPTQPIYPEMVEGEGLFWIEGGPAQWLTDRGPLADFAPLTVALGYGHRIGEARLAWRLQWITDAYADGPVRFLHLDFLSVERLYAQGTFRPFTRFAFGVGLDLLGAKGALGSDGYFNDDSGASAGLSLTLGTGLDVMLTDRIFTRIDLTGRVHGGAGTTGIITGLNMGFGLTY